MGAAESTVKPALDVDFDSLDLYAVLEVSEDVSEEDLKKAYRRRALQHHPDKNVEDPEGATRRFARIQEAYETLTDPSKRRVYDTLKAANSFGPAGGAGETEPAVPNEGGDQVPGGWGRSANASSGTGWFSWLFGSRIFEPANPFLEFEPAEYIKRYQERPHGISVPDIFKYLQTCVDKLGGENGNNMDFFTAIGNLFECLAFDERQLGERANIPGFGSMYSPWCPAIGFEAPHYAIDFYQYWGSFQTKKTFEWMQPYDTSLASGRSRRLAKNANQAVKKGYRDQYNDVIRKLVKALRESDPRYLLFVHLAQHAQAQAHNQAPPQATGGHAGTGTGNGNGRGMSKKERKRQRKKDKRKNK